MNGIRTRLIDVVATQRPVWSAVPKLRPIFQKLYVKMSDPEHNLHVRLSFVGEWAFSRTEAAGHAVLEWEGDAEERAAYDWLIFTTSGIARTDPPSAIALLNEAALYAGPMLPPRIMLQGKMRNVVVHVPRGVISQHCLRGVPVATDRGLGALLASSVRTIEAQAVAGSAASFAPALSVLAQLIEATFAANRAPPPALETSSVVKIARINDFMQLHLEDSSLSAPYVARACGVSVRQLHRLFALEQDSFSDTVRRMRLERAVGVLANPAKSIGDAAHEAGFSDAAYFSTVFRKTYGVAPKVWRTQFLNRNFRG